MGVRPSSPAALADKQAITEILHRYCRSMDRMDAELALSCWHPGGTDDHAPLYAGSAEGFVEWLWPVHREMLGTRHSVSNILIELDGDTAASETYWTVILRVPGGAGPVDIIGCGRYLDRLERIDGVWGIRHRQSIHGWDRVEPVAATLSAPGDLPVIEANNPEATVSPPSRDRSDPSYAYHGILG